MSPARRKVLADPSIPPILTTSRPVCGNAGAIPGQAFPGRDAARRILRRDASQNRDRTKHRTVMAGLDPAIHLLRKILLKRDGCAGLRLAETASAAQAGQARA
jgi:hypothetical protein